MEDLIGEIVTAVVVALVAAGWRQVEAGRLKRMLRAVIEGVEQGTSQLGDTEKQTVKGHIRARAEASGAQARLHSLVDQITKEKA